MKGFCLLMTAIGLVAKRDAIFEDVAPVWHFVTIHNVMGIEFGGLGTAHDALMTVTVEDRFSEGIPN